MEKLSTAIIEGAKLHGQCFGFFLVETNAEGQICKTSAIGAAIFASLGNVFLQGMPEGAPNAIESLCEKFPILTEQLTSGDGTETMTVLAWIELLNHVNRWKREKIASWLYHIEDEFEIKTKK